MKDSVNNIGPHGTPEAESVSDTLGVAASVRLHWPEYLMEAGEMSLYHVLYLLVCHATATPRFSSQSFSR